MANTHDIDVSGCDDSDRNVVVGMGHRTDLPKLTCSAGGVLGCGPLTCRSVE
jgi:hypothetical protein